MEATRIGVGFRRVRIEEGKKVELVVEAEGFKLYRQMLDLQPGEKWEEALHIELNKNQGVVFGSTWENSLGMKFEPVGNDLMVSALLADPKKIPIGAITWYL